MGEHKNTTMPPPPGVRENCYTNIHTPTIYSSYKYVLMTIGRRYIGGGKDRHTKYNLRSKYGMFFLFVKIAK